MRTLREIALFAGSLFLVVWACAGRDEPLTQLPPPGAAGAAGTRGTDRSSVERDAGADSSASSGGSGGAGALLDDPFGVGPTYCDTRSGEGGDACIGFTGVGFFTEPAHQATGVAPGVHPRIYVSTEYTPSTALKHALEGGVRLSTGAAGTAGDDGADAGGEGADAGAAAELPFTLQWITQGFAPSETAGHGFIQVALDLVPAQPLAAGWYSLTIPFSAREALGAAYVGKRFTTNPLFVGGSFVKLDDGSLRADFHVGSSPP